MPEHSPSPSPAPIRAAGLRRITLDMRAKLDEADRFAGLPRGTAKPFANWRAKWIARLRVSCAGRRAFA